jgi:predicted NAD/FAD-binding protein
MPPSPRLRIAVIGGGVAGLVTARLLQADHDVVLYEASAHFGGHARSIAVPSGRAVVHAETGFKYFFEETYPTLIALTRELGLPLQHCKASLSMTRPGRSVLVLPPRSVRQVARIALSPRTLHETLAFYRFLVGGRALLASQDWRPTLRQYAESHRATAAIAETFLYPFLASSWGAPLDLMPDFPAYDVLKVLRRGKGQGPAFYEFDGGSSTYVATLVRQLRDTRLRGSTAAHALVRDSDVWRVVDASGAHETFDRVVLATGAREARALLGTDPAAAAHADVVGRFRHFDTRIVIHRDSTWMPPERADWCTLNIRVEGRNAFSTEWAGWREREPVFRTWLPPGYALPQGVVHDQPFQHLVVTSESPALQRRIAELQGKAGIYLAGMYTTDVDDHESALLSAMNVARLLGRSLASPLASLSL